MRQSQDINSLWHGAVCDVMIHGHLTGSRNGASKEIIGWSGRLVDVDRNVLCHPGRASDPCYGCAELLWYLRGSPKSDMIEAYAPSYKRYTLEVNGHRVATGHYGARWTTNPGYMKEVQDLVEVGHLHEDQAPLNQMLGAVALLIEKPDTRQCVVTMWDSSDLADAVSGKFPDIPCTLGLQFIRRDDRLHCVAYMRSNDLWLGMPYDVYCFTTIQRIIAQRLGIASGTYTHCVGSAHIYAKDMDAAQTIIGNGVAMSPANGYAEGLGEWDAQQAVDGEQLIRDGAIKEFSIIANADPLTDAARMCGARLLKLPQESVDLIIQSPALRLAYELRSSSRRAAGKE